MSPLQQHLEKLEEDFVLMGHMFFGDVPGWRSILETIKKFEAEFNSVAT